MRSARTRSRVVVGEVAAWSCLTLWGGAAAAQAPAANPATPDERITDLEHEVDDLKKLVHELKDQLGKLTAAQPGAVATGAPGPASGAPGPAGGAAGSPVTAASATAAGSTPALLRDMTINASIDGYYEYNLNSPVGRVNELRAYDVSSNSFSLNQADLVIESAADVAAAKRYGVRLDLQFGQATSTLQGNAANELRPEVYRNVFQAYGTYVFPVAQGLTVDFGKFASSIGIEGNFTKDQLNYSRSFWFDYLPFYHMGLRTKLALTDEVAVNVWVTNGTDQTEAFNNYKDQMYGVVITPTPTLTFTLNYYLGQEHADVIYLTTATPAQQQTLPNEQGTYIEPIANAPNGKLQIFDDYVSWQPIKALTLAAEADYVQQRLYSTSIPDRVEGGAVYAGYQFSPQIAAALRGEYLADVGGLFSGTTQYLKEGTLTFDYRPVDGFLLRGEYRRDESNRRYFIGHSLGLLETSQPTIGLGMVWWFGQKQGAW